MRAAVLHRATASRRRTPSTRTRRPAPGHVAGPGDRGARRARSTCCAPPARRTSARPPLPYVPGVQGVGVVERPTRDAGTRVWFARRPGWARRRQPGRAGARSRTPTWCRSPTACPTTGGRGPRALGRRGLDGADLARAAAGRRAGARARRAAAPSARPRSARPRSLGAGRVVAVCRRESAADRARAAGPTRSSCCPRPTTSTSWPPR